MSNIVQMGATLPPSRNLEALSRVEQFIRTQTAPAEIRTEHVLHGGMYTRTVRLLPGTLISGCLYKVPTMLIVNGEARVYVADGWTEMSGYNVIAASAGRKQLFFAISEVEITMLFPTSARTVEEAENEMTDEVDLLVSRQDGDDLITITGE